jgi:two-component system, chemotaxis family, response regulator Rcp1
MSQQAIPIEILLVEDNPGDARLTQEALRGGNLRNTLHLVPDGVAALAFLRREEPYQGVPRPDLVLLDLNLPRMDGRELLGIIKSHEDWRRIPVIVLTTSNDDRDIRKAYNLHANCFITKPVQLEDFLAVVQSIQEFWLTIVRLPANNHQVT